MASDFPEFMNTREAEQYCRLGGFAKRRVTGNGPPYLKRGSRVLYEKAALDRWLRECTFNNTSEHSAARAMAGGAAA